MKTTSVESLQKNPPRVLGSLARNGTSALVDESGETTAYLIGKAAYEAMQYRMLLLGGIARGEKDLREGRTYTHEQVVRQMRRWLKP